MYFFLDADGGGASHQVAPGNACRGCQPASQFRRLDPGPYKYTGSRGQVGIGEGCQSGSAGAGCGHRSLGSGVAVTEGDPFGYQQFGQVGGLGKTRFKRGRHAGRLWPQGFHQRCKSWQYSGNRVMQIKQGGLVFLHVSVIAEGQPLLHG